MLQIFHLVGELITRIVVYWQGIEIGGFYPFWYLVGIMLLTVLGFFVRGVFFGSVGSSEMSSLAVSRTKTVQQNKTTKIKLSRKKK